jgi:hypothetical protein
MFHDAWFEAGKDLFYFRVTLGGKEQTPAGHYYEVKSYIKLGPFEVYRGLYAYSIALAGKFGAADLMLFHSRSPHPKRVQFSIYLMPRQIWRAIKRKVRRPHVHSNS